MDLVIYHGNCIDGYTAAWAAWRAFKDAATYVPASYGQEPPDVAGKDVLIVDFSYPRAVLEEMHGKALSLRVLDHHLTAQKDLDGLPYATFDMNRSGAGLTWDVLHGGERPWLVDYVQDRDLWRWALRDSKAVNAYVSAHKRESFHVWDAIAAANVEACADKGRVIGMFVDRYVEEMCAQAMRVEIDGVSIPIVNAPYINISELVGKLAESSPFAVGWFQGKDGRYLYSLRSRDDGFDVSALAKRFGGGGHKNSAGFNDARSPFEIWRRA